MPAANLYDLTQVAALLGISRKRVHVLRAKRNVGRYLGGVWIFDDADLAALAVKGKSGRPRKVQPDNHLETGKANENE